LNLFYSFSSLTYQVYIMSSRNPQNQKNFILNSRSGMALLNVIMLLILVGAMVIAGYKMMGPIIQRGKINDTKTTINSVVDAIISWSVGRGHLPGTDTEFSGATTNQFDAWGRKLRYLYDSNLASASNTNAICNFPKTNLTINGITNIAFAALSLGDDLDAQSLWSGSTLANNDSTYMYASPLFSLSSTPIEATLSSPDIFRIVTLNELKARIGCAGYTMGQLRILNNELPSACAGSTTYSATLYADGGAPPPVFSVVSAPAWIAPSGLQVSPSGIITPNTKITDTIGTYQVSFGLRDFNYPSTSEIQRSYKLKVVSCDLGPTGGQLSFKDNMPTFVTAENKTSAVAVSDTTLLMGGGANDTTGCYWYPIPQTLSHHVMRGYYEFRFNPADTSADSRAQADGFTFTLIEDPGVSLNTFCGTTGAGSNLGYRGLPGDSLAVEFDTYPSDATTYADPAANHIAMVRNGSNTHNTATNPTCATPNNGCYYTATNNTWFEEGNTHRVRIELDRQYSNATCTTMATNGTYALLKVWMDPTLAGYLDLTQNYSDTTPVLQQCVTLPDANDLTAVDNVIFGFTEATGGAVQNLSITNFAIGFYCTSYRVWNTTGARYDFYVAGSCRDRNNNLEITDATTVRLSAMGTGNITRDNSAGGCTPGTPLGLISFAQAAAADDNGNCMVNYGPGDTLTDR
jgi:hypothetical protein